MKLRAWIMPRGVNLMTIMNKQKIQHLCDDGMENYQCKCGNDDFFVAHEDVDHELGTTEMIFVCECGARYEWTYGDVTSLTEGCCD